jgi:hypothetical protein
MVNQETVNRDVDILFEIDNSPSMAPEQANLVQNFSTFINVLKTLPQGLPNVHIAVVTSDMGAGQGAIPSNCRNPDMGNFVFQQRAAADAVCLTAKLNPGATFIESLNGGTTNNFAGDITDVFRCIAQVGVGGCGYESHLEAVRAALGDPTGDPAHDIPARPVPQVNQGFLRPGAYLAIVFITNEEECSVPDDSTLFDSGDTSLGPLSSRCFSHADVCDGQLVANYLQQVVQGGPGTTRTFQNCDTDDTTFYNDPRHAMIPVPYYVNYFAHIKQSPTQVLLSGIIPPATPYGLFFDGTSEIHAEQQLSCPTPGGTDEANVFGQPIPRLTKVLKAFGGQAVGPPDVSICDASYATAMTLIGQKITQALQPQCLPTNLAKTATGQYDCAVQTNNDPSCNSPDQSCPLPAWGDPRYTNLCSPPSTGMTPQVGCQPAWNLTMGTAMHCSNQLVLEIGRPPGPARSNVNQSISCACAGLCR